MDERIEELIAVGASITANCQPCLAFHTDKARQVGASDEEIARAIAVGKMVRRGAAGKMDKYSAEILENPAPAPAGAGDGCGCPE